MFKTKVLVALALAFICLFSLVACETRPSGNDDKTDKVEKTSVTTTENTTTTTVPASTKSKFTDEKNNLPIERTVNQNGNANDEFIESLDGFTLKILYPQKNIASEKHKENNKKSKKAIKNLYGIKIKEDYLVNDYNEALFSELSAKRSENHIYFAESGNFATYFKNGFLADLTLGMEESGVDFKSPWYVSKGCQFLNIDGKQYGWMSYEDDSTMPSFIIYNKKLLRKKGLKDPVKLADEGKWTVETLKEYSLNFSGKTTGFYGRGISLFATIANQNGVGISKISKGSQPMTNINNPKVATALETYGEWVSGEESWCETFHGKKNSYAQNRLANGKIAMYYGGFDDIRAIKGSDFAKNVGIVSFPTKTESGKFTNVCIPKYATFIPACHQQEVAKILFAIDEYYRYNYRYVKKNFIADWKEYLGNNKVINNAFDIKYGKYEKNVKFCFTSFCEKPDASVTTESILLQVQSGEVSATQAINDGKNALTKEYSEVWKGHRTTGNV